MSMHEGEQATPEELREFMWEEATQVLSHRIGRAIEASAAGYASPGNPVAKLADRFIAGERSQDLWRLIMALPN